ncbi:MAG: nuclear transport factor 2 family protein [Pseudomonadota bacterium]
MKTLAYGALLAIGHAASPALAAAPSAAATTVGPKATVQALYAAFGAGDMAKIMSLIAEDATWTYHAPKDMLPFAGTYKGRDGVAAFFANDAKYVEVKGNDVGQTIGEGDTVVVLGQEHGVVRATGKAFDAHWTHVFTVKNGQITGFEETIDSAAIFQAFAK